MGVTWLQDALKDVCSKETRKRVDAIHKNTRHLYVHNVATLDGIESRWSFNPHGNDPYTRKTGMEFYTVAEALRMLLKEE